MVHTLLVTRLGLDLLVIRATPMALVFVDDDKFGVGRQSPLVSRIEDRSITKVDGQTVKDHESGCFQVLDEAPELSDNADEERDGGSPPHS